MSEFKTRQKSLVLKLSKSADMPDDVAEKLGSVLTVSGARPEFEKDGCKFYMQNLGIIRKALLKYANYFWASGGMWLNEVFFIEKTKEWCEANKEKYSLRLDMTTLNAYNLYYMVPMTLDIMRDDYNHDTESDRVFIGAKKDNFNWYS